MISDAPSSPSASPSAWPTTTSPVGDPSSAPAARTADPEIGVLLRYRGGAMLGHCVATVVAAPTGDVVLTAAHCLGRRDTYVFAPGYTTAGPSLGLWTVVSVHTDAQWQARSDPLHDFAFLTVRPTPGASDAEQVQRAVGGLPLGVTPAPGAAVRLVGYPSDRYGSRIGCTATVRTTVVGSDSFPTVDCPYFTGGTSGSPMISASGAIVGLIGGWESGGCTQAVSYTSPFTTAMDAVLLAAEQDAPSSPAPRIGDPAHCAQRRLAS